MVAMKAKAKNSIRIGKIVIPKNQEGIILRIENSHRMKENFPNIDFKPTGWYYIVKFPELDEYPYTKEQIEIS